MDYHHKQRKAYRKRFRYICMFCLNSGNYIHHIIPLSKGGKDLEENIILLCFDCHKKAKLHSHFRDFQVELLTRKHYFESRVLTEGFSWISPSFKNTIYKNTIYKDTVSKKEVIPYEKTTHWVNEGVGVVCIYCHFKIFNMENHKHHKKFLDNLYPLPIIQV